ncbi:MAG: histidine phosphatase family protein [Lachnospiraceae bacterium]|nr:histidine phosphatase family protein [Lachnospiraceae bacterium]MBQ4067718.1 histidine phosphatase family protein [Lachnospiraceae bacterium]
MKMYFLRHGETNGNKNKILQGRIDNPLNDDGRLQAMKAREEIEGISFEAVYTSPLQRAKETAMIASGLKEDEIILDKRIVEISFGDMEGNVVSRDNQTMVDFFYNPEKYVPVNNAESYEEMLDRTKDFLRDIEEKYKDLPDTNILVVSHGALIHGVIMLVKGLEIKDIWKSNVANCSITVVEYKEGKYSIIKECNQADRNYVSED